MLGYRQGSVYPRLQRLPSLLDGSSVDFQMQMVLTDLTFIFIYLENILVASLSANYMQGFLVS